MALEFKQSVFFKILEAELPEVSMEPSGIKSHFHRISTFIAAIPDSLKDYAYAEGKWTIAQVLGHITDTQTVFLYRILSIARGNESKLPGFDENRWVATGNYAACTLPEIKSLYDISSAHTLSTVLRLRKEDYAKKGEANQIVISVEEILGYLMAHEIHHLKTIQERYLNRVG